MKKTLPLAPVTRDMSQAAELFAALKVTHAAALHVDLPEGFPLVAHRVDDLAALRREANALGAMIVSGKDAAAASRMAARMNKKGLLSRFLPAAKAAEDDAPTLSPDIEEAIRNELPQPAPAEVPLAAVPVEVPEVTEEPAEAPAAPEKPEQPAAPAPREGVVFLVYVDSLEDVPSLVELPGAQPDLVIVGDVAADEARLRDCLAEVLACGTDTAWCKGGEKSLAALGAAQAEKLLAQAEAPDPQEVAVLLLRRGYTGGYCRRLAGALSAMYDLPMADAVNAALSALRRVMDGDVCAVPAVPGMHLMDVDDLVQVMMKPIPAPKKQLSADELRQVARSLYAVPEKGASLDERMARQRALFDSGATLSVDFRLKQLKNLLTWIDVHEAEIEAALFADLGKCAFEAYETEILLVKEELKTFIRNLPHWQRDVWASAPIVHWPSQCRMVRNPYGLALIMSPWNYPFLLSVDPLIAAIGGGNCVVLKPSAYAPATSALLREMAEELFDPEYVFVVEGGRKENQALLEKKFDTIFFTGSVGVGKVVMKAAAEHLTPVTLELGGKSPCIVDATADIALAAKRIAWGKFINAGQTCVAPDYVLCHASVKEKLVAELAKAIRKYYGQEPVSNPELCHIINDTHFQRLCGLMEGMEIAIGGQTDATLRKIEPTVLTNVSWDDPVMQEEIFGPILPILTWEGDIDSLVPVIEARPRPLAAYLFTNDKHAEEVYLRRLRFGGGCINDVLCHLATSTMPFGGVGESGMGHYHGKYGFDTFTHLKSVLKKSRKIDLPIRYAPYGEKKIRLLRKL